MFCLFNVLDALLLCNNVENKGGIGYCHMTLGPKMRKRIMVKPILRIFGQTLGGNGEDLDNKRMTAKIVRKSAGLTVVSKQPVRGSFIITGPDRKTSNKKEELKISSSPNRTLLLFQLTSICCFILTLCFCSKTIFVFDYKAGQKVNRKQHRLDTFKVKGFVLKDVE